MAGVNHVIDLLTRFVEEKKQDFDAMPPEDQNELLHLFRGAPGDFKNLIIGNYGKLPMGWPADWVYTSCFGEEGREKIAQRHEESPLDAIPDEDLKRLRHELTEQLDRTPNEEEFILYLMHPKDALDLIRFREKYGDAPLVLPTDVWKSGLQKSGDKVEFEYRGVPYSIERVSIGSEHDGVIHGVMKVNNQIRVFKIETPRARKTEIRMAKGMTDIGAPINGTVWRIGNPDRGPVRAGDIVHKGEEIANLEAMKMENAIFAPYDAQITEITVRLNQMVKQEQLLFVLEEVKEQD
jgi:pyruvate carboxylase